MNDITIFIFGIGFALTAGAAFAFMFKPMSYTFEEMNKPIRRNVHPEMKDVQTGDELLVFNPEEDDEDDDGDIMIVRK